MAKLGVNIDHIATLRQARRGQEPEPVTAAALAEMAGADGITIHLREDRRHIQDRDLRLLRETARTRINLEMAPTQEMVKIALDIKPDMVTFVPEKREELTTEGGLEVKLAKEDLGKYIRLLHEGEILVSLFIDPDIDQVKATHKAGADYIEIHTGRYAEARNKREEDREFNDIFNTVKIASKLHLGINAGHGLDYWNIKRLLQIDEIEEFNIGHSIIARAVMVGMERAVKDMVEVIKTGVSKNF
ncbi:MAG: pyridoxine 5'-phosphate synthase [Proteobacteria bacterium]|nr:pyridoxine 5'-phosphate synthase [Pseudomonadota bacterium]